MNTIMSRITMQIDAAWEASNYSHMLEWNSLELEDQTDEGARLVSLFSGICSATSVFARDI